MRNAPGMNAPKGDLDVSPLLSHAAQARLDQGALPGLS
jgi:hypothetical protein